MKDYKPAFVEALGIALTYSRTGVKGLSYRKDSDGFEGVTIRYSNGKERTINVTGDSCLAIMHDIYRALA